MDDLLNHVVRGARAQDPALLLIHPLGADLRFWDECLPRWQDRIPCVACDLRSAGDSPRSPEPVSLSRHLKDIERLRRALGIGRLVPVGCAVGAMVAASYAATHPGSTAALVLASPTPHTSPAAREMLMQRANLVRDSGMQAVLPAAVDRAFEMQPRDARYRRYHERFAAQDPAGYVQSVLGILSADITAELPNVRCPTLVAAAAHDVLLPPAVAQRVHELIPGSEYTLLPDAAHFAPFQQPEQFARLVISFLGRAGILRNAAAVRAAQPLS